ncbi:M48 family metalloprotease [Lentzea flaviverrucosa]|uniref:Zn-dependent protease with chaperone function n=1 Tax=Lentzea flaviverrucosa TaxID=200379 RepID=A0A1H9SG78_9PSEU|nr:M48 family metalloprotease [Lentzea flaviverrucosa]RDI25357.1 Zn-dependent protease with chaperone function [Lentzea flaviverrucosa]SER83908.1 Zn-dependent protease with chaperone function [Lentzea flaviverrucosa]
MDTAPARSGVDERAMTAGTTVRFALLVVLLLVASGGWMLSVATGLYGSGTWGCRLAAGVDPNDGGDLAAAFHTVVQRDAYQACLARFVRQPPGWVMFAWPLLVLVVARMLFLALPWWRERRGLVVPLEKVDPGDEIRAVVKELAGEIGLAQTPRVVVDLAKPLIDGVVLGSNSRPTVCMYNGMLSARTDHPEKFRAVLLHELAHIRNRDVTITYATIATWRAFLVLVLLPYVTWYVLAVVDGLASPFWPSYAPTMARTFLHAAFLVVLVYLARSDVLRSREIYADLAAVRHGARVHSWTGPEQAEGKLRRARDAFVELWLTHPRRQLREKSFTDPAVLFHLKALPMFLTGAAITMIISEITGYLKKYGLGPFGVAGPWQVQVIALYAPITLATVVVGVALWRAVLYGVLTPGQSPPSGVGAGLWLGGGMAAAELVLGEATIYQALPSRIEALLLVVAVGAVFTSWIAQCAQLWITTWRGRSIAPLMWMTLAGAVLVLSSWFVWWQYQGTLLLAGVQLAPDEGLRLFTEAYPATAAAHPTMTWAVNVAMSTLAVTTRWPLFLSAIGVLWVVPLLAWVLRPRTEGTASWTGAAEVTAEPLPQLRKVLLPGLLAAVLCWGAAAAVQAYLHGLPLEQRNGLYIHIYLVWMLLVMVASSAFAAVVASLLAGRLRLLVALIAGHIATLVGFLGILALAAFDGCVAPLSTFQETCGFRLDMMWSSIAPYLALTLVATTVVAVVVSAVVSVLRKTNDAAPSGKLAPRRLAAGLTCAAAALFTAVLANASDPWRPAWWTGGAEDQPQVDAATADRRARSVDPHVETVPTAQTKTAQLTAWRDHGGVELLDRFGGHWGNLTESLPSPEAWATGFADLSRSRPVCADIGKTAREAGRYFRVPDAEAQVFWRKLVEQAEEASNDCDRAAAGRDRKLFLQSVGKLTEAADAGLEVYKRLPR